jgi:uncharacterized protein YccT (UPF0319 family)
MPRRCGCHATGFVHTSGRERTSPGKQLRRHQLVFARWPTCATAADRRRYSFRTLLTVIFSAAIVAGFLPRGPRIPELRTERSADDRSRSESWLVRALSGETALCRAFHG